MLHQDFPQNTLHYISLNVHPVMLTAGNNLCSAGSYGKVKIRTIASATIKEAAEVFQNLGLINAMCLDGGGSIALYHDGKSITSGRNVNNAVGCDKYKVNYTLVY